jgi:hypothetical protein
MNTKLPVLISITFGLTAFMSAAQPALADVSIEIISRSSSGRSAETRNSLGSNAHSFQPTAGEDESNHENQVQHRSEISFEAEQDSTEPADEEFEGILIRI